MTRPVFASAVILFLCFILLNNSAVAQFNFQIEKCNDSSEVIALVDTCLLSYLNPGQYKNIQFKGDPSSIGYFSHGYLFGFSTSRGIAMSTGFVENLHETNNCITYANGNTLGVSDPDLVTASGQNVMDACVIEFDFKPVGDSSMFNYVFGSEEYHEWVTTGFNDVLGIFLSGPNIAGTYSNDAINIAIVPGTSLPVSIDNVNCGRQQTMCIPPLGNGPNCQLLVDNTDQSQSSWDQFVLDAYTLPFGAVNETESGTWHHVKIAIGDGVDAAYDSGIFLEAGSFYTGLYTHSEDEKNINENAFKVEIFPNPAKESFQLLVKSRNLFTFEVLIFNQYGVQELKKILNHQLGQNIYKIEIPNLNPGIHFVRVLTSSGMTRLLKLEVVN